MTQRRVEPEGPDIDDVPDGWTVALLGECVDILDHMRVPVNSDERKGRPGSIPYFGATGQVGWIDDYLFDEQLVLLGEDGAPFLDKSKPIAYLIEGKSWVNNHAHVLRAVRGLTFNQFIKRTLDAHDYHSFVNGTTRLKLTQEAMRSIPVRLPPLAEQRRIIDKAEALLACTNAARDRLARVPAMLKRLRLSVLAAACSGRLSEGWRATVACNEAWIERTVDQVTTAIEYGYTASAKPHGRGPKFLRITDIQDGRVEWSDVPHCEIEEAAEQKYRIHEGDILFARTGATTGKSFLIREAPRAVFASYLIRVRPENAVVSAEFLYLFFQSPDYWSQVIDNLSGNAQPGCNATKLAGLVLSVPSLAEQAEIVRRANALFEVADIIERRVAAATARAGKVTQAVLAKAFQGELVPTEAELARQEGREYESAAALLARLAAETANGSKSRKRARRPPNRRR